MKSLNVDFRFILIWTRALLWESGSVGRRDIYVQIITDCKFGLCQCLIIVSAFLSGASHSYFAHSVAWTVTVWVNQSKVEVGTFAASLWIDIPDQGGQLSQGCIQPSVDLQFVAGCRAMRKLTQAMMSSGRAKDSQQKRTGLKERDGIAGSAGSFSLQF
jgi:hypothetical protein